MRISILDTGTGTIPIMDELQGLFLLNLFIVLSPASGSFLHLNVNQYSAEDSRGKSLQSLEFFLLEAPVLSLVDNGHPGLLSLLAQGD